jgi:hypothetical protein
LYRAIRRLLMTGRDVTRHALICELCHRSHWRYRTHQQFVCPNVYRAVFERFEVKGQVVADPHSDFGSKAIAAVMNENSYHCQDVNEQLAGFLGASFGKLDREHYDVVLLDYGWVDPGALLVEDLKKWARRADMKIVYVPKHRVEQLPKPYMSLKIMTKVNRQVAPDWIYCYM